MDERVKKITAILVGPKIGMRVRLIPCGHGSHFGNSPLQPHVTVGERVITEIATTNSIYPFSPPHEVGVEKTAYMTRTIAGDNGWWVYRHQFELLSDDDE